MVIFSLLIHLWIFHGYYWGAFTMILEKVAQLWSVMGHILQIQAHLWALTGILFKKISPVYAQSSYPSMTDKRSRAHCVRLLGRQEKCLKCSDHSRSPHGYVILRRTKLMPIRPENMVRRSVIPRIKKASYTYREFMRFSAVERRWTTRCVVQTT